MSDQTDYTQTQAPAEDQSSTEESRPHASDVPAPPVVAQEPKQVGEEANDNLVKAEDNVAVVQEQVAAQVAQPRESDNDKVHVHEVSVKLDEVITDTSDPRAVQVPPEGRSPLEQDGLPIARLDAPRVEDVFASEAATADDDES